jgi:hypothetical protein
VECNPLQGPYVNEIIKQLESIKLHHSVEPIVRNQYINETQFDSFTITQEMIDARGY